MKTALIVVDVQHDFCPGGAMGVEDGDQVIDPINQLVRAFEQSRRPVYFTRDWHPANHCSFEAQGGTWPAHCVQDTPGAAFHESLYIPEVATVISKAATLDKDAYSGFEGTDLDQRLKEQGVEAVVVAGLATDYCVKRTALDAHRLGYRVTVATDAVRAVNLKPDDGRCAIRQMQIRGVAFEDSAELIETLRSH